MQPLFITSHAKINKSGVYINKKQKCALDSALDTKNILKTIYKNYQLKYPKFYKMDLLGKLAFLSTELMLKNKALSSVYPSDKVGVVLNNADATLNTDKKFMQSLSSIPSPAVFVYTLPNIMIGEICIRHKITGENAFFVSEKPTSDFLFQYIQQLFFSNQVKALISGWINLNPENENFKSAVVLVENQEKYADKKMDFTSENIAKLLDN